MSGKKKCSVCGDKAQVFVNLVKTDHTAQSAYCALHAEELGLMSTGAYAFLDSKDQEHQSGRHSEQSCPSCGFTLRDWKRTGRFGCSECYESFQEKIEPALQRLHTDVIHRGKIPRGAYSEHLVQNRIRDLQKKLDHAVQDERYEEAAETRDLMSELKSWQPNP